MNNKVLLVDDEVNLLHSLRRSLRGRFDLTLAEGGEAGIAALKANSSFAVVVTDMQMPNVNGLKVLSEAKSICPNTVRIMLTGNIDQQTAVDAVNQGGVFRFVNKPCEPEALAKIIDEALVHHDQLTAEKVLLSRTLTATIGISTEILALANPHAHGRSNRLKNLAQKIATRCSLPDHWQLEIAAMLSQIGCVAANQDNLPRPFSLEWDNMLRSQAEASSHVVAKIPRLERVTSLIHLQAAEIYPADLPAIDRKFAKILRMMIDYDYIHQSESANHAIILMESRQDRYDGDCFEALKQIVVGDVIIKELTAQQLVVGMVLEDHVLTNSGDILISKGHELTETLIQRLKNFQRNPTGIREPIRVRCSVIEVAA